MNFKKGEWGNAKFTVYASYEYIGSPDDRPEVMARINYADRGFVHLDLEKLSADTIRYLVIGDSISTGCEAFPAENSFFNLFADNLKQCTGKNVIIENIAIGGENSSGGLARFDKDVLGKNFDLISIAYGMNDHNEVAGISCTVPLTEYEDNLRKMIVMLGGKGQIILSNFCYPNDRWYHHGTKTNEYAEAVRRLGLEYRLPVSDVEMIWLNELQAGKTHKDLLMNDINHPNNYGHRLYAAAFSAILKK